MSDPAKLLAWSRLLDNELGLAAGLGFLLWNSPLIRLHSGLDYLRLYRNVVILISQIKPSR